MQTKKGDKDCLMVLSHENIGGLKTVGLFW